jgi:lysozyme
VGSTPTPASPVAAPAPVLAPGPLPWIVGSVPLLAATITGKFESFRSHPYDDNGDKPDGTWTIGYGSIRDAAGNPVTSKTPPITEAEAVALKQRDMQSAARHLAKTVNVPLTNAQAAVLISFIYNLGEAAFTGSTLRKLVNSGGSNKAIGETLKQWRNQKENGVLVPKLGLVRRRHAEWAVYCGQTFAQAYGYAWAKINKLDDWPPLNV